MTMPTGRTSDGTWICATSGERDVIGNNQKLQVGDRAYVIGSGLYRCTVVGGDDASTWVDLADADQSFSGSVTLSSASPNLIVGDGSGAPEINIRKSNAGRGILDFEGGSGGAGVYWRVESNASENFVIGRFLNDVFQDEPLSIATASGDITLAKSLLATDGVSDLGGPSNGWKALYIKDGITAPGTPTTGAVIYVDAADGDCKIKFSDGVTKTLAVDT